MADKALRGTPEISFVDTDPEATIARLVQAYEFYSGRTLGEADPMKLCILWASDLIVQIREEINYSARQNIPSYATGTYLDALGQLFKDVERNGPQAAKTTLEFAIAEAQPSAVLIPLGTRATPGSGINFATAETAYIPAGETALEVAANCTVLGVSGNGYAPGAVNQIVDPFPHFLSVENTTISEGGADEEDDDSFYYRMRQSEEAYSTAGPTGAYVYHALSASNLIEDVAPDSPTPGVADIRIMLENGQMPGPEIIATVLNALNGDKVRPFTEFVQVAGPDTQSYNVDITFYISSGNTTSAADIAIKIREAVQEYIVWQSGKMGRDINPDELIYRMKAAGVKRVEVREPQFTIIAGTQVGVIGSVNIVSGGMEDE